VTDQYLGGDDGALTCVSGQSATQTFTVGVAGTLAGIEVGPSNSTGTAVVHMTVSLVDAATGMPLGPSVTLPGTGFPKSPGTTPVKGALGAGYFDFSSFGVSVSVGQHLAFHVACPDASNGQCSSGACTNNALPCSAYADCRDELFVITTSTPYSGGTLTVNGTTFSGTSLAFKTVVKVKGP
jgi:hypothetical protein